MRVLLVFLCFIISSCSQYEHKKAFNPVKTKLWVPSKGKAVKQNCGKFSVEVGNIVISSRAVSMAFAGIPYMPLPTSKQKPLKSESNLLMLVRGDHPKSVCSALNVKSNDISLIKDSYGSMWHQKQKGFTCGYTLKNITQLKTKSLDVTLSLKQCPETTLKLRKGSGVEYNLMLLQ